MKDRELTTRRQQSVNTKLQFQIQSDVVVKNKT